MRDLDEEHSLLLELAERMTKRPVLVTFNGKSFDWPLLETRYRMTRAIPSFTPRAHLDLLHPARALWKLRLGSVRLVELERRVLDARRLGWDREDDVESALIPQHYFDYLRGGPAEPLAGVVKHNQMDLRGLAALFHKIDTMLASPLESSEESEGLDLFGLSRFLQRRGDSMRAQTACAQALAVGLPSPIRPKAQRELAVMARRRGEYEMAVEIWKEMADGSQDDAHACEQLAIYYERRAKDICRAIEFAKLGLLKLRRQRSILLRGLRDSYLAARLARWEKSFKERVARLEKKAWPSSPVRRPGAPEVGEPLAKPALW